MYFPVAALGRLFLLTKSRPAETARRTQTPFSRMRIAGPCTTANYTVVPNEILNGNWPASLKVTWMQLLSLCRKDTEVYIERGKKGCASMLGVPYSNFHRSFTRLIELGGIRITDGIVQVKVPDQINIDADKVYSKPKKKDPDTILEAIDSQPRRAPSGITAKESWQQIKKVGDEKKPEMYLTMKENIDKIAFIGLETQAKRLGISRPNYPQFVEQVLAGLKKDKWWPTGGNFRLGSVFGTGDIPDKKFISVEQFYRIGADHMKPRFDKTNKQHWLQWYQSYDPSIKSVEFMHFKNDQERQTYFDDPDMPERPDDTAQIFFVASEPNPVTWTYRGQARFLYIPDFL